MTNLEWMEKEYPELIIEILCSGTGDDSLAVIYKNSTPTICDNLDCNDCKFSRNHCNLDNCCDARREWLKKEHRPPKKVVSNHAEFLESIKDYFPECEGNIDLIYDYLHTIKLNFKED